MATAKKSSVTARKRPPAAAPASVDAYAAALPPASRRAFEQMRRALKKAVPGAEEVVSYRIAALRHEGRIVLYYAGWKDHVSLYPATAGIVAELGEELAAHRANRGTLRFALDAPLPRELVARIVAARLREMAKRPTPSRRSPAESARGGRARSAAVSKAAR